ncbi:hypothetical protein P4S68_17150 [Pseudoalteromonas sp. Hal099]
MSAIPFAATVEINGDAIIGNELSANVADENGFDPALVAYTWFADDVEIADETLATYTITESQLGKVITVNAAFEDNRGCRVSYINCHSASRACKFRRVGGYCWHTYGG